MLKGLWIWEVMEIRDKWGLRRILDEKGDFWSVVCYGNEWVMVEKVIGEREKEMEGVKDGEEGKEVEEVERVREDVGS